MYVNVENSFISDNPYYFYNDKSPKTPDSTSSKGFSFFKRRNSKGSSCSSPSHSNKAVTPQKSRTFNSATLSSDASIVGSPRGSLRSLGSYSGNSSTCIQEFELQPMLTGSSRRHDVDHYRDRLGSYNESVCYSESDDVFVQQPSRHMPLRTLSDSGSTSGSRRHSVGNFSGRDRMVCGSLSDEVPKMHAPKPPAPKPLNYRHDSRKDNCRNSNMDDILIVTAKQSERAILWANFLKSRFDKITKQRGRQPFNFLYVKMDEAQITTDIIQKCSTTLLQIVILCPALMALPHSILMTQLSKILNPEKVLGILLDVAEDKVLEIHKSAFPSYRKWRRCVVRDHDQSFVGNVLGIATDILGRALCQRPPCHEINGVHGKNGNTEAFTVVPRKVKIGQNKVLVLLAEPLAKDDWIKLTIEKSGEIIDVTNFKKRNPYTLQFNIPETCMEISTMVEIRVEKNQKDLGSRPVKCESRLRELEQLLRAQSSPIDFMCNSLGISSNDRDVVDLQLLQNFQKNMPPNFHLLSASHDKHSNFLSARESSTDEYPTLLHFAARWGLERLCIQLLECPGGDAAVELRNCSNKTPADIAEQEGFIKLAKSLKSFSQMHEFTTMYHYFKGISDSSSNKIIVEAQIEKPVKALGQIVNNNNSCTINHNSEKLLKEPGMKMEETRVEVEYMEMSGSGSDRDSCNGTMAVTNLNYINIDSAEDCNLQSSDVSLNKKMSEVKILDEPEITSNVLQIDEPPYYQSNENNRADEFSQECSNLLENFNTSNASSQSDYILQPSNIPVNINKSSSTHSIPNTGFNDYMIQPSNRPVEIGNYMNEPMGHYGKIEDDESHVMMYFEKKRPECRSKNGTLKRNNSNASKGTVDDELAEIFCDFKNNVLSIREVEQLVEKWKNRNDVKQSFKDKQDQLERMREEYEKIQEQMEDRLKRPTPFERIKKLFSRNKSHSTKHQHEEATNNEIKSYQISFQSNQRPISSLSLQSVSSSSSSGRMSTGSACSGTSLGDSGTHSDHEDRRHIFAPNCRPGCPGSLMENYLIPPTPKPFMSPATTPTSSFDEKERMLAFSTQNGHNRTPAPASPSEHYIMFPSNVPIYPPPPHENHCNGGLNTIVETKETPTEMNGGGVTIQPIKVQKDQTIIYSQIQKKQDLCTSFKQTTTPAVNGSASNPAQKVNNCEDTMPKEINICEFKKEMGDIYKNINGLNTIPEKDSVIKLTKSVKDCSEDGSDESCSSLSRQSSGDNNSLSKIIETNENDEQHNYMNV